MTACSSTVEGGGKQSLKCSVLVTRGLPVRRHVSRGRMTVGVSSGYYEAKCTVMLRTTIIGAGPVGLVCAHLLAALRMPVTLLERKTKLTTHPSAHVIHPRAGEILRDIGLLDDMLKSMAPPTQWKDFNYCSAINGTLYRTYDNFASPEHRRSMAMSDVSIMHFPQHKLVELLYRKLPPSVEVRTGTEITGIKQGSHSVTLQTRKGDVFESDYVLACDGANSAIRQLLGIPLKGTELLQTFLNIHFTSKDLGRLCAQRPAMINFIYNSKVIAALITHSLEEGEFIMQVPFLLSYDKINMLETDDYEDMVNSVAGEVLKDIQIKSVIPWKMGAQWVEEMRHQRTFLVGDAAHKMPPTGGFGMCTGLSDARNICWKLAFPGLLDSYSPERVSVVRRIVEESVSRFQLLTAISSSCNLNYSMFSAVKGICDRLPFGDMFLQSSIQVGEMLFSDSNLADYLADDSRLLRLVYPEEDLGQRITKGFIAPSGGTFCPNFKVQYHGKEYQTRELPAVVMKESGRWKFLHLKGQKKTQLPDHVPVHEIPVATEDSFVMRPDALLYSRS